MTILKMNLPTDFLIQTFQRLSLEDQEFVRNSINPSVEFFLKLYQRSSQIEKIQFDKFLKNDFSKLPDISHNNLLTSRETEPSDEGDCLSISREMESSDEGDGDCLSFPILSKEELDRELDFIEAGISFYWKNGPGAKLYTKTVPLGCVRDLNEFETDSINGQLCFKSMATKTHQDLEHTTFGTELIPSPGTISFLLQNPSIQQTHLIQQNPPSIPQAHLIQQNAQLSLKDFPHLLQRESPRNNSQLIH